MSPYWKEVASKGGKMAPGSGGAREREGGGGRKEREAGEEEEEEEVERKHGLLLRRPGHRSVKKWVKRRKARGRSAVEIILLGVPDVRGNGY